MIKPTSRIAWIDAARGMGIVLVVVGHVERGLVAAGIAHGPTWAWMDYSIYTFHMPTFFLLAGVNAPRSLANGRRQFLKVKLWTIAYPYVLWSLIQGGILTVFSSFTNGQAHASDLLTLGWHPTAQFWFLYVLMLCQFAALILASRKRTLAAVALASAVLSMSMSQGSLLEDFLHAFPFFAAGILLSGHLLAWRPGGDLRRGYIAAVGLLIAIPVSGSVEGLDCRAGMALPASICGIVLLISVSRLLSGTTLRIACLLGRISMTIYVTHIVAAAGTRVVLTQLHVAPNPWLYLVACVTVGVAAPVAAHATLRHMRLLTLLGLAPLRPGSKLVEAPA